MATVFFCWNVHVHVATFYKKYEFEILIKILYIYFHTAYKGGVKGVARGGTDPQKIWLVTLIATPARGQKG